jgi:hypothetical protein
MNGTNIYRLENIEDIKRFIISGKAIITLESKKTGRWFTYRIKKARKNDNSLFFVSLLTGLDNEKSYSYIGTIFNNNNNFVFKLTKKSNVTKDSLSYKAFNFFFSLVLKNMRHADLEIYHTGVCGRCSRALTVPESLVTGLGPECRGLVEKNRK